MSHYNDRWYIFEPIVSITSFKVENTSYWEVAVCVSYQNLESKINYLDIKLFLSYYFLVSICEAVTDSWMLQNFSPWVTVPNPYHLFWFKLTSNITITHIKSVAQNLVIYPVIKLNESLLILLSICIVKQVDESTDWMNKSVYDSHK